MGDKSVLSSNMKKATIELLLLRLLKEGDMYGYQLSQEIKKRSDGKYSILEGSMYPILYRLSDRGLISSSEVKVGKRQTRVYYHLEQAGDRYYESQLKDYYSCRDTIQKIIEYKSEDGD